MYVFLSWLRLTRMILLHISTEEVRKRCRPGRPRRRDLWCRCSGPLFSPPHTRGTHAAGRASVVWGGVGGAAAGAASIYRRADRSTPSSALHPPPDHHQHAALSDRRTVFGVPGFGGPTVPPGPSTSRTQRAHPHPEPGAGGQLRWLLQVQLRDGQRHRPGGAGLPEERRQPRCGGAGGPGVSDLHVARGRADPARVHRRRERLRAPGRSPAHATPHPTSDPARSGIPRHPPTTARGPGSAAPRRSLPLPRASILSPTLLHSHPSIPSLEAVDSYGE